MHTQSKGDFHLLRCRRGKDGHSFVPLVRRLGRSVEGEGKEGRSSDEAHRRQRECIIYRDGGLLTPSRIRREKIWL